MLIRVSYVRAMIIITIILAIMFAAPPILVGAWLMAVLLGYRIEYYYYIVLLLLLLLSCMVKELLLLLMRYVNIIRG